MNASWPKGIVIPGQSPTPSTNFWYLKENYICSFMSCACFLLLWSQSIKYFFSFVNHCGGHFCRNPSSQGKVEMEGGDGRGTKKPKGCGLLSSLCGRRHHPQSKKSIAQPNPRLASSPAAAKVLPPTSVQPRRRSSQVKSSQMLVRRPASIPAKRQQVNTPGNGLSGELDRMIFENRKARRGSSGKLVRASSGNVMMYGELGNIWGSTKASNQEASDHQDRITENPEKLKEMGNQEFRAGRLEEALALYNRAIALHPYNPSFWSNRAAALAGMGMLLHAVLDCKEALKIHPSYSTAHHRLATLYLRLGEAERAVHHYKLSAKENDISKATNLQMHILRCNEARNLKEWQTLLKECQSAISAGADSAPKVYASQAEALLRLGRHEEADSVLKSAPKFETDAIINVFGAAVSGYILVIEAEVDLASGRFDEAVKVAERAACDHNNREISDMVRRARAVSCARNKGNELFKSSNYREACNAYGEGLDHDPLNAILLCNRAACLSKLEQWEKAIEECDIVLNLRPSYAKARLRRADCFAKMEKWEASIQDYQILTREFPGDSEVSKALLNAQSHRRRKSKDMPRS